MRQPAAERYVFVKRNDCNYSALFDSVLFECTSISSCFMFGLFCKQGCSTKGKQTELVSRVSLLAIYQCLQIRGTKEAGIERENSFFSRHGIDWPLEAHLHYSALPPPFLFLLPRTTPSRRCPRSRSRSKRLIGASGSGFTISRESWWRGATSSGQILLLSPQYKRFRSTTSTYFRAEPRIYLYTLRVYL